MSCRGEQRKHPDYKEMVWNHCLHLRQPDRLYSNSGYHLLVAEGEEKFSNDFGLFRPKLVEYDYSAHQKCDSSSDDKREESLQLLAEFKAGEGRRSLQLLQHLHLY